MVKMASLYGEKELVKAFDMSPPHQKEAVLLLILDWNVCLFSNFSQILRFFFSYPLSVFFSLLLYIYLDFFFVIMA
eukprot:gene5240-3753_t